MDASVAICSLSASLSEVAGSREDNAALKKSLSNLYDTLRFLEEPGMLPKGLENSIKFCLLTILECFIKLITSKHSSKEEIPFPAAHTASVGEKTLGCLNSLLKFLHFADSQELWKVTSLLLDVIVLDPQRSSDEVLILSFKCLGAVVKKASVSREKLERDIKKNPLYKDMVTCLIYKSIENVRRDFPKGNPELILSSLMLLEILFEKFDIENINESVFPMCSTVLFSLLSKTAVMVERSEAIVPFHKITVEIINTAAALISIVFSDTRIKKIFIQTGTSDTSSVVDILAFVKSSIKNKNQKSTFEKEQEGGGGEGERGEEEVKIGKEWYVLAKSKICNFIKQSWLKLVKHPSVSVRHALSTSAILLIKDCSIILEDSMKYLLRIILSLSKDDWTKVSEVSLKFLSEIKDNHFLNKKNENDLLSNIDVIIFEILENLEKSVKHENNQNEIFCFCKQLLSALEVRGTNFVNENLISDSQLQCRILEIFEICLEVEIPGNGISKFSGSRLLRSDKYTNIKEQTPNSDPAPPSNVNLTENQYSLLPLIKLPRMALNLKRVQEESVYEVVVGCIRGIAKSLVSSDHGMYNLMPFLEIELDKLQILYSHDNTEKEQEKTLETCVIVNLLTEILFGASGSQSFQGNDIIINIVETYAKLKLWNVNTEINDIKNLNKIYCKSDEVSHALLKVSLMESICVLSGILIKDKLSLDKFLLSALMPFFEQLVDSNSLVRETAHCLLDTLYTNLGYRNMEELMISNIDYIIDALCQYLRLFHPKSPLLFSFLFSRAPVLPNLLALLSEPTQLALRAISIFSRAQKPEYTPPFVQALFHISSFIEAESLLLKNNSDKEFEILMKRLEINHEDKILEFNDKEKVDIEEIKDFFLNRENKLEGLKNCMTENEVAEFVKRSQNIRRAASLAKAIVELVTPLFVSNNLNVAVISFSVTKNSLSALSHTTAAYETEAVLDEQYFPSHIPKPVLPKTPLIQDLMESVFSSLISCLCSKSISVLEPAIDCLFQSCRCFGASRVSRKFQENLWPVLKSLLKFGSKKDSVQMLLMENTKSTIVLTKTQKEQSMVPAVQRRIWQFVLTCIKNLLQENGTRPVFRFLVPDLFSAVVIFLEDQNEASVRETAKEVLVRLSRIDPDYVWIEIMSIITNGFRKNAVKEIHNPNLNFFKDFKTIAKKEERKKFNINSVFLNGILSEIFNITPDWHDKFKDTYL